MKKYSIWQKIEKYMYKQIEYNHVTMDTLDIFLNDGIGFKPYIKYLNDPRRKSFSGNISWLEKKGNLVTIEIDDYVYPSMPLFTTTINNLLKILHEYQKLEDLEVDQIEISLENDKVSINGKWEK